MASSSLKRAQNKDEGPVWPVSSLKSVDFEDETASNVEGDGKTGPRDGSRLLSRWLEDGPKGAPAPAGAVKAYLLSLKPMRKLS